MEKENVLNEMRALMISLYEKHGIDERVINISQKIDEIILANIKMQLAQKKRDQK
ncbi:MAG: Spo0E family sporulation regulatory protein-aspartic acid phosphatase [Halanaerobiales bacterium]|nr:Spo0E family sporulation regulatory protein-aspartic acid phosphatase [Halanaerobiales bacterium]